MHLGAGDDPPRGTVSSTPGQSIPPLTRHLDRTSELRGKGFSGRSLGPKQMTTDTAVRVTRMVIQDQGRPSPSSWGKDRSDELTVIRVRKVPLEQIPYVDYPEIKVDEHEATTMPFRYVQGPDKAPIMPEVLRFDCLFRSLLQINSSQGMMNLIKQDSDKSIEDLF